MRKFISGLFRSSILKGVMRGMGSAAVAALGWKIASDVYDGIKKKAKGAGAKEDTSEPG
jgi:hypothetical protein